MPPAADAAAKPDQQPHRRRAVITGASRGIGASFAAAFARQGFDLLLIARSRAALDALAERLRSEHGVHVEVMAADLIDPDQRELVEAQLRESAVDVLVNDAGIAAVGRFTSLATQVDAAHVALNIVATVRLTRAVLPAMLERRRGAVINVSSIAAFVPARFAALYGATKAYLNSFSEALFEELRGSGVQVQALCPGFTRTEFVARAGADPATLPRIAWMTADAVVAESLAALRRGQAVCVPGRRYRALMLMLAVLPRRWARRLAGAGIKRWTAAAHQRDRHQH